LIYNPNAPAGNRFTVAATSTIARMYHSETLLMEDGRVLILGSTPNANADELNYKYPNERRIEAFTPAYLLNGLQRPTLFMLTFNWKYGELIGTKVTLASGNINNLRAVLFTNGFVTHSVHMGQRMVELVTAAVVLDQNTNTFAVSLISPRIFFFINSKRMQIFYRLVGICFLFWMDLHLRLRNGFKWEVILSIFRISMFEK
jgi:hypothetical protein